MTGIELELIKSAKPHQIHDALKSLYDQVMRAEKWNDEKSDQIITARQILIRAARHCGVMLPSEDDFPRIVEAIARALVAQHVQIAIKVSGGEVFDPVPDPDREEMPF
jgi:hypothetical protein